MISKTFSSCAVHSVALALVLGGCGGDDASSSVSDAGGRTSDAAASSSTSTASCSASAPFDTVTALPGVNTSGMEGGESLSHDERTVFFYHTGAGANTFHIYQALRSGLGQPFAAAAPTPGVNSDAEDVNITFTPDDLTMVVASRRAGGAGGRDFWTATRSSASADFGAATNVATLNSAVDDHAPIFAPDGRSMTFASKRDGGMGGYDLYIAAHQGNGVFAPPTLLEGLSSAQDDITALLMPDGLTMYFASTRPDAAALGSYDVYRATRSSNGAAFGAPMIQPALSSASYDAPYWVSPDGCRIYLASDRSGGQGGMDLYVATQSKP